ncbi:hypothetical protein I3F58_06360 [Streptomyces sp. MUM 203J]|uniref:hypothetical protein n=1 Tax=Streptomyces sp. MUM 203J TaxID=2791990 RepID=UPI001F0482E4|nr:hypothetical protein [Streptomyces sp. MUM 203J]MCH0539184.1 hypothetical protein [Streptomyces sp. MUM 203J]
MRTPRDFAELFGSADLSLVPIREPGRPCVEGVLTEKADAPAKGLPPVRQR